MGYTAFVGTNNNPGDAEDVNDGALSAANVWPPKSEAPNFRDALVKY